MTERIHLGRFVKAFGIRGELKLYTSDDFWPEALDSQALFIARESDHEWSDPLGKDVDVAFYRIREGAY